MADAGVVNTVPSAENAEEEQPLPAPVPVPAADVGKGEKAPVPAADVGKNEVRPCVVLALQAATAPPLVAPKPRKRRQANPAPAPAASRQRLESHVAAHALPTTRVPPPVSENHLPGNIPWRYRHTSGCDACALGMELGS
ncbi:translation initiation factor IF-2-like isoform X2 [Hordeum vulgare subsp. vulgare]|uniref:translation initiation factor IF-2-like isoform X2 n=1 Tax=Hordeum vulgare subsp. vulgare TaxID=112509 RepID=UPI001D1A53C2|nr:translation initiation factor IF-2-like isoform X2 [Hordeum vulgare subsp. vulgare]